MLGPIIGRLSLLAYILLRAVTQASQSQIPLPNVNAGATSQAKLELTLSMLSSSSFTTLSHPAHPAHQVRIKGTDGFCDPTVKSYAGYLDAAHGSRHMFFYFFESRDKPEEDDMLMWINGGPGSSSAMGLFMELGPCNVDTKIRSGSNGTVFNPYGWNNNANIFFLDQPAGVGFSYDDLGRTVDNTHEAAKDVHAFLTIFFETFHAFQGRPFHISGESYGGRYIPLFAAEVKDQNSRASESGVTPINLKSVLIGNGATDFLTLVPSYYDVQCTRASLPPITDISTCVRMKQASLKCRRDITAACRDIFDSMSCGAVYEWCQNELVVPYSNMGRNPYDMTKPCPPGEHAACYKENALIEAFLNNDKTQSILGIDKNHRNFSGSNRDILLAFKQNLDSAHETRLWVAELLERDVDVLIYAGTHDFICNWVGNLAWAEDMEWAGKAEFNAQDLQPWTVDGKQAGRYKSSGRFTFATVEGAGHMVPFDKPVESLAMVQRWLAKRRL